MIKLVIWDLDGTLVDSSHALAYCMNLVLDQHGMKTHSVETYKRFIGNGLKRLCQRALGEEADSEAFDMYYQELLDNYKQHYGYKMEVYEGIFPCLDYLKQAGCHMAVNTNKRQDAANAIVDSYFGGYGIEHVYGASEERPKKPDPHSVHAIMAHYGVSNEEVLYIGDSDIDMATGSNAQVHRVAAEWGFRTREELLAHNPEHLARTPQELLVLLKELVK